MGRTVVAGVGNDLLGDDGLGVHVVRELASPSGAFPPGVEFVDAGLCALDLLAALRGCERLVLVDAVRAGGAPGTVYRTEVDGAVDELIDRGGPISMHQLGLGETLRQAREMGILPARITLIGAEPAAVEPSLALSEPVKEAAQRIAEELRRELRAAGLRGQPIPGKAGVPAP